MSKEDEEQNAQEEKSEKETEQGGGTKSGSSSSSGQFEQGDLDKVAGKARGEGHTAGLNSVLKAFGFDDEEAGIKYLAEARKVDDAKKTELEKATAKLDDFEKRASDAETALSAEKSSSLTTRLKSAVMLEIVSDKELRIHPEALDDVWSSLAENYLGDDGIHVTENGKIKGVSDSIKKLLKDKPYFASTSSDENHNSDTRRKRDTVGNKGEKFKDDIPKYGKSVLRTRI